MARFSAYGRAREVKRLRMAAVEAAGILHCGNEVTDATRELIEVAYDLVVGRVTDRAANQ